MYPFKYVRNLQVIIICLIWMAIPMAGCARDSFAVGSPVEDFAAYLDQEIPRLLDRYQVPGLSMALIQEGELAWSGAYGYADLGEERAMTVDAVCRAESISKSVTAWGVMRLAEEGRLDLDAPVQRYLGDWQLPETEFDEQAVTPGLLLSNAGGLPVGTIGEEYPPGSMLPALEENLTQEAILIQEPGKGFLYSNPGFNLLELVVHEVTGQEFSSYMESGVLRPLGLRSASYSWQESYRALLPTGYEMTGDPVPAYVYPAAASGGLFANVEDLARFVSSYMVGPQDHGQSILKEESIRTLQQPRVEIPGLFGFVADSYGYGVFIETLPDGRRAIWHGGQGHGWMTHFHAVPQSGAGIVILTNSQRSWPLIARVLADWARWNELGNLKFTIINQATLVVGILAGLIAVLVTWQSIWLIKGFLSGRRRFAPLAPESLVVRSVQFLLGGGLIAVLVWSAAQPYLFISSIFPGTIDWLAGGLLVLALVNILSACIPVSEQNSL